MDGLPQHQTVETDGDDPRDRAAWWRARRHQDLEGLTASFRRHRYAPHSHDTYVVGVVLVGCDVYTLRGARRYAGAGRLCLIDPGDVHDGAPLDGGYSYRMSYPAPALLAEVAAELGMANRPPHFPEPVVEDPEAAAAFVAAHRAMEAAPDPLAADQALHRAWRLIVGRHAEPGPRRAVSTGTAGSAVARVRDLLEGRFGEAIELADLAAEAGLSRHHLLRLFKRETGLTPHAYLTDCRVRAARRLLAAGTAPAEVAATCGFCDQSHLNRAFKARAGSSPGTYRAA